MVQCLPVVLMVQWVHLVHWAQLVHSVQASHPPHLDRLVPQLQSLLEDLGDLAAQDDLTLLGYQSVLEVHEVLLDLALRVCL